MRRFALTLLCGLASAALFASVIRAHTAVTYYPWIWKTDKTQLYHFTASYPTGEHRSRWYDAKNQWNGVGQPHTWNPGAEVPDFQWNTCGNYYGHNGIHWGSYDGQYGVLGVVQPCLISGSDGAFEIYSMNALIDSSEDWYTGTGNAGSSWFFGNNPDAWSVASHEMGHMTGFYIHWDDDSPQDICQDNSDQHTMCKYIYSGTERSRTPEIHDRHTFDAAY